MGSKIRFCAVGDISLGDHPLCVGFGAFSKFKMMPSSYPFNLVLNHFKKSDLLFGNLECTLSKKGLQVNNLESVQMRGDPHFVTGLANAGFTLLNVANNHSMQHGKEAFQETLNLLEDHGIRYCGVNLENHLVGDPSIIEVKGIKIAFLGYSLRPRQYFDDNPLYTEGQLTAIENDIKRIRQLVDTIIVSFHWGEEFIDRPSPQEIWLARQVIDAGADLIIGHHPHVLRGLERYKHGVIVYSLGNFVCDMVWDKRLRETLIFGCHITKSGIRDIQLTPVYINDNYQPEILNDDSGEELLSKIQILSKRLIEETLEFHDEKVQLYQKEADTILQNIRFKSHKFFLSRLHKYPVPILIQEAGTYLKRRIEALTK